MSKRIRIAHTLVLGALSVGVGLPASNLFAQAADEQPVAVENSRVSVTGVVTSNGVPVRCGPSDTYYSTMKIDKGTKVTVVGIKGDWLKILPPEGSFCYISKMYVEKHGDGSVGRVTHEDAKVRAGSSLTTVKYTVLCGLNVGADVQIIGEQDEYFKIKPPKDAYLFVKKQDVMEDPNCKPAPLHPDAGNMVQNPTGNTGAGTGTSVATGGNTTGGTETHSGGIGAELAGPGGEAAPTTNPSGVAVAPSTNPADRSSAEALLDAAEAQFKDASAKPLDQQPLAELIKQYTAVQQAPGASEFIRRVATARIATMKVRQAAYDDMLAERKASEALKQKQLAAQAEAEELQARVAAAGTFYTAVGNLSASSLQSGTPTLYRLTDPTTGRTIVYLRTNDPSAVTNLDKFVGVKGEIANDPTLKVRVITPTEITSVDQARVNNGITAQIMPPSMIPQGSPVPASAVQQ